MGIQGLCRAIILCGLLGLTTARAAEFSADGFSLAVPEGWTLIESTRQAGATLPRGAQKIIAVWVWKEGEEVLGNLNLGVRHGYLEVAPARLADARREISSAMEAERACFRVEDLRVIDLGGFPAYRLEATWEAGKTKLRQLQVAVSGRRTFVLTLTAPEDVYRARKTDFDRVLRTLRLEDRAGLLDEMPAWFCGGALGLLAGLAAAARAVGRAAVRAQDRRELQLEE